MARRRDLKRDEVNAKQREYTKRNKESVAESYKRWAALNKEHTREYAKLYYRKNHEKQRTTIHDRRSSANEIDEVHDQLS